MNEAKDSNPTPDTSTDIKSALKSPRPVKFKPGAVSQEVRALDNLLSGMNRRNPGDDSKVAPTAAPGEYSGPLGESGQTLSVDDPALEGAPKQRQQPPPQPTPPPAPSVPDSAPVPSVPGIAIEIPQTPPPVSNRNFRRVFLTGRSGAGTSFVAQQVRGARVIDLRELGTAVLTALALGYNPPPSVKQILEQAVDQLIVITGVDTREDFELLSKAGFEHFHICCSSTTLNNRSKRIGIREAMAINLDQQTAQLVRNPGPDKPNIVWNDPTVPLPPRLASVAHFVEAMSIRTA